MCELNIWQEMTVCGYLNNGKCNRYIHCNTQITCNRRPPELSVWVCKWCCRNWTIDPWHCSEKYISDNFFASSVNIVRCSRIKASGDAICSKIAQLHLNTASFHSSVSSYSVSMNSRCLFSCSVAWKIMEAGVSFWKPTKASWVLKLWNGRK